MGVVLTGPSPLLSPIVSAPSRTPWGVAALIVLGAAALGVVAWWFWGRRRAQSTASPDEPVAENTPLTPPPGLMPTLPAPEPLPVEHALDGGRYIIKRFLGTEDGFNVYEAKTTAPMIICAHCQLRVPAQKARFCVHCKADLQTVTLVYPNFLLKETLDYQVFSATLALLALDLTHANVLLPVAVFAEEGQSSDGEPARYFRVQEAFESATALPTPQEADLVLTWGVALAQGLAYLHAHHVTLRQLNRETIAVDEMRARCVAVENARVLPEEAWERAAQYFTRDAQQLAALLLDLAGGEAALPDYVAALLTEARERASLTAEVLAETLERALAVLHESEVSYEVGARTDVGRVRAINEDSVLARDFSSVFQAAGASLGVFAVADGMGGHAAGDVASQLVVEALSHQAAPFAEDGADGPPPARAWAVDALRAANQAVYAQRRERSNDMGCTLVMALFVNHMATIVNVGDSRAYRLSPAGVKQITLDHSLVARLVEVGQITEEEARHHPQKNVIYRVIGDRAEPEYDLFEAILMPGEALLLCSDGLSGMLLDEQIWQIWRGATSAQDACDRLVDEANVAGGVDNISVVLVQVIH